MIRNTKSADELIREHSHHCDSLHTCHWVSLRPFGEVIPNNEDVFVVTGSGPKISIAIRCIRFPATSACIGARGCLEGDFQDAQVLHS